MKVLILSCSTGEGHNSCAAAVREFFESKGHMCDMADVLGFISHRFSEFISRWHSRIYRYMPKLFAGGYDFAEKHEEIFAENKPIYRILTEGADRLSSYIENRGYDVILCTHVFSSLILTGAKRQAETTAKTAFIATDYTCSPSTGKSELDYYCIPDESLREEFIKGGVPEDKIISTGIPVRSCFLKTNDKAESKRKLGLPEDHEHLLVMCGSMGCGPIAKLTGRLRNDMPESTEITVVCGTNRKLYRQMKRRFDNTERVHVLGFVNSIYKLMDGADLYVTKPGGLSITEAAHKALPMAFLNVVSGCEVHNMKYFIDKCFAVCSKAQTSLGQLCTDVLFDRQKLGAIKTRLQDSFSQDPMTKIYEIFMGDSKYDKEKVRDC